MSEKDCGAKERQVHPHGKFGMSENIRLVKRCPRNIYIATLVTTGKGVAPIQQFAYMIGNTVVCVKEFFYMLFIPGSKRKLTIIKREVLTASGLKLELSHSGVTDGETSHKDCPKFIHTCGHIQKAARMCGGGTCFSPGPSLSSCSPGPSPLSC